MTYWVVSKGVSETISRALFWSGESPFYYLIAWATRSIAQPSEFVMRLPSMIAMGAAAYLVYRIGERLMDREAGLLSAVFFACAESIAFAAADARPYAIAMLMLLASTWMLLRWLDTGRLIAGAGYALFTALTIYSHYIFSAGLLVPALYALHRSRSGSAVRSRGLFAAWIFTGLLILPVAPNFWSFYRTRSMHLFASTPSLGDLLAGIAPPVMTSTLVGGSLLLYLSGARVRVRWQISRSTIAFLIAWAVLLPVLYFLVSVLTETKLFVPRYFLSTAPGLALLSGAAVRWIGTRSDRRILALLLVGLSIFRLALFNRFWHGSDDWRGAMATVRGLASDTQMPVLMCAGFVEGGDPARLADPVVRDAYLAPLSLYPGAGNVIPLPYPLSRVALPYMEGLVTSVLEKQSRFLLVTRGDGKPYQTWLQARLAPGRFQAKPVGNFRGVRIAFFSPIR